MDTRLTQAKRDRLNGVFYYTDEELEQRRLEHNHYHRCYRQSRREDVNKQSLDYYYRNKEQVNARRRERYKEKKAASTK
jgi:hypothetical protein